MPLTPEQKAAWKREQAQRQERDRLEKEKEGLRQVEARQIDEAIEKVGKMERNRKVFLVIGVVAYCLAVVLFFLLRK